MGIALIHVHCNQVTGSVTYDHAEHDEKQIPLKIDTVVTVFFQKPRVPVHLLVTTFVCRSRSLVVCAPFTFTGHCM